MGITLEAHNYRGLRHAKWSPSEVCALVGPNGSGKTTLLKLFETPLAFVQQQHAEQRTARTGNANALLRNT